MAIQYLVGDGVQIATESFRQLRVVVSERGVRAGDGGDCSAVGPWVVNLWSQVWVEWDGR